jgi:hypothetical protein
MIEGEPPAAIRSHRRQSEAIVVLAGRATRVPDAVGTRGIQRTVTVPLR